MPTQKEAISNLLKVLKDWQKIEDAAVENTAKIIVQTENPLIKLVMEIINQDSAVHKKAQQLLIDHFEKKTIAFNPDEMKKFWDLVEEHDKIEKKTIELAKKSLEQTNSPIVKYILSYLLTDEQKHDRLLEEIEKVKAGMYPYGGM